MFGFITDAVENAINVVGGVMTGESVSTRQVAQLVNDGLTAAAIAATLGVSIDVVDKAIESLLDE